jgi:hypothetical protein
MVAWLPAVAAAGLVTLIESKRRTRNQYRDIPMCDKQWPIVGRVSAVKVCLGRRHLHCAEGRRCLVQCVCMHDLLHACAPSLATLNNFRRLEPAATVQEAKTGRAHRIWEDLVDQAAASNSSMIQLVVFGRRAIVLADPKALETVLRKQKFVPKSRQFYRAFMLMVRPPIA